MAARIRAYLEMAGHGADVDGPLFRPLKHNGKRQEERRRMDLDAIDRVVRKYAAELSVAEAWALVASANLSVLKVQAAALSLHPWLNTPDEWLQLEACLVLIDERRRNRRQQ
jgi:hypothetical protein